MANGNNIEINLLMRADDAVATAKKVHAELESIFKSNSIRSMFWNNTCFTFYWSYYYSKIILLIRIILTLMQKIK